MIKKIYRLREREVKKVLTKAKPFFSYGIVLNAMKNKLPYNRFAIVIWAKSVNNNITRNFFRRRFYDFVNNFQISDTKLKSTKSISTVHWNLVTHNDFVFVVKKQTKLDKKDEKSKISFDKDLAFLMEKIKK